MKRIPLIDKNYGFLLSREDKENTGNRLKCEDSKRTLCLRYLSHRLAITFCGKGEIDLLVRMQQVFGLLERILNMNVALNAPSICISRAITLEIEGEWRPGSRSGVRDIITALCVHWLHDLVKEGDRDASC